MTENLQKEKMLLKRLQMSIEHLEGCVTRERRVQVSIENNDIVATLLYAKEQLKYIHLSHISCVDWIEHDAFELVYILWSPTEKINLIVKTHIDRENPIAPNIDFIWRQANTYERELREMFGIEFTGLEGEQDFILEDWKEIPPMRRDFDTAEFVKDAFFHRPGRENAQDVRATIAKRSGEEIPDFAKKYSRD